MSNVISDKECYFSAQEGCEENNRSGITNTYIGESGDSYTFSGVNDVASFDSLFCIQHPDILQIRPIPFQINIEEGLYILTISDLNVSESGQDISEAKENLTEYILDDFLHWQNVPKEELSDEAQKVIEAYSLYLNLKK